MGRLRELVSLAGAGLVLTACGEAATGDGPTIDPITWTDPPAYCAFLPEGHAFDINDQSTWKFMFVTVPEGNGPIEDSPAHMIIDGAEVMLMRDLDAAGAGYRTWVYKAVDSNIEVEIQLESGASEAGGAIGPMPQSGKIRVRAPKKGPAQTMIGGCGL